VASKKIELPDIGPVSVYKRRGSTTIRLSINARGEVRITQPYWLPYSAGEQFARSRAEWIAGHIGKRKPDLLTTGQAVGKQHHLVFEPSPTLSKISSRLEPSVVRITYPAKLSIDDPEVQSAAKKAAIRTLRAEAEALLPGRLAALAKQHGFNYTSVQVKQLTGRWGSCDNHQNIVLNLFLMQVSWDLIDYVLLHELTHTNVMKHGPEFWRAMERVLPDTQIRRKAMRQHQPVV